MNEHSIGKTIATLRKEKGWTQVELAEKLGVSDKAVSKWESEAGMPEISQLPALANLFNVTIDFLMTGKAPEKEVITMSKAELCAKNDDVSMVNVVKDLPKDENGKDITDYIVQYESLNVFKKLCEIDNHFIKRFKLLDAVKLAILANSLNYLSGTTYDINRSVYFKFENEKEILSLLPEEDKGHFKKSIDNATCILPRSFFTMLVTDKRINDETMSIILSNQNGRDCIWFHAIPYMIEETYKNGNNELFRRLLDLSKESNKRDFEFKYFYNESNWFLDYFFVENKGCNSSFGYIRILESTIRQALGKGDFDLVNEFNDINSQVNAFLYRFRPQETAYVASDDEIRVAKLKLDKNVSKTDLMVQSAIHNGIISIKELLEVNDYDVIKKALHDYPISLFEMLYKAYMNHDYRKVFEYGVDNNTNIANAIVSDNEALIKRDLFSLWTESYQRNNKYDINRDEIFKYGNRIYNHNTVEDALSYIEGIKQKVLDELSNKINKDKIVSELTKEYFYSEFEKGNIEMVIIKLCVRMEAILKFNGYDGEFSEMLSDYCRWCGFDEDDNTPDLLDDLRRHRNDIVHSEKSLSPMSNDDIEKCIDYICSL